MKAQQHCRSQSSQWRLKDSRFESRFHIKPTPLPSLTLLVLLCTCLPAIHFLSRSNLLPCMSHCSELCSDFFPVIFFSFISSSFASYLIDTFHITIEEEKPKKNTCSLFDYVSQSIFFTFPAPFSRPLHFCLPPLLHLCIPEV